MIEIATIAGWGLAAVFMMLWLVSIRMRNYALHDSKAAQRMEMRIAVDFVTDVLEPATNDLFASVEFLPARLNGDWNVIDHEWPEWRPYRAARLSGRKWETAA
ncbi:hypothetical protein ACC754_13795 [Rhizobium johnstonii]|uniref:hypothetical protein n=1 Tax=Rhizobium johnstonii TaxID=3019933 RepID=UPI003F9BB2C9